MSVSPFTRARIHLNTNGNKSEGWVYFTPPVGILQFNQTANPHTQASCLVKFGHTLKKMRLKIMGVEWAGIRFWRLQRSQGGVDEEKRGRNRHNEPISCKHFYNHHMQHMLHLFTKS